MGFLAFILVPLIFMVLIMHVIVIPVFFMRSNGIDGYSVKSCGDCACENKSVKCFMQKSAVRIFTMNRCDKNI